jgi:hypothetical protein
MSRNYATNFKGEKQVAMKTTGYEKLRVTVKLSTSIPQMATNTLPPCDVSNIKHKDSAKEHFFNDVIVRARKMH